MKRCTRCGGPGPFYPDKRTPGSYMARCKACLTAAASEYNKRNRRAQAANARRYRLRKKSGLTI